MRALRNVAAVVTALLAIAGATAIGVAARGGNAGGDSAQGQYGATYDCKVHPKKADWKHGDERGCPGERAEDKSSD